MCLGFPWFACSKYAVGIASVSLSNDVKLFSFQSKSTRVTNLGSLGLLEINEDWELYAGKEIPVNERIVTPREIGDKQFDITELSEKSIGCPHHHKILVIHINGKLNSPLVIRPEDIILILLGL